MLKFGNKEFRNLQEQVKKNMDDILFILQEEGVLNEFGIKVVGQEDSVLDMPTVDDYKEDHEDWSYGDAYAIGTEEPYELYILTRANGTHPNDYWFNIGEFPAPGPQGEQGPTGETGPQGPTGPSGQDGVSPEISIGSVSATTLSASASATASVSMTGTYAQPVLNFAFGIPQGQEGSSLTEINWGDIQGSIANQTDLVSALQGKANVSALSSYATKVYADSAISALSSVYMTEADVGDYLTDNEYAKIQDIPTDTSDLTNNAGFITNSALSGYATQSWVSSNFLSIDTPIGGAAQWGSISGTLSDQLDLMSKFSEYAKIEDIPSLSGYATESWIVSQNYASQTWVNNQISNATSDFVSTGVLSSYATVNELSSYAKVSDLSSYALQSELSLYASVSALNSAISGVESIISSLDYASVGALSSNTVIPDITGLASEDWVSANFLSSGTYIPEVSGTNDGSYWTSLTIDGDTYDIGGGASGDYVETYISNIHGEEDEITDESWVQNNNDGEGVLDIGLGVKRTNVNAPIDDFDNSISVWTTDIEAQVTYKDLIEVENPDYDPEDSESQEYINQEVDCQTRMDILPDGVQFERRYYENGEEVDKLVDIFQLQDRVNEIPEVSGNNDGSYWTDLTIGEDTYSLYTGGGQAQVEWGQIGGTLSSQTDLMSKFSEYAELSASNTFTGSNFFEEYVGITGSVRVGSYGISFGPGDARIYGTYSPSYINTNCGLNVSGTLCLVGNGGIDMSHHGIIFNESSYPGYCPIMNVDLSDNAYEILLPHASGTLALASDIPSLSGYAELSASNTFTANQFFSTIYTRHVRPTTGSFTIGATGTPYQSIYVDNIYARNMTLSSVSYASEVWTFTLSDNTSVSKTILVG